MGDYGRDDAPVARTKRQKEIMKVIVKGNEDGSFCDIDQIIERLSWKPSKDSFHFSLRPLIRRGLVERKELEKRRGAQRRIIAPTLLGYKSTR